MQNKTLTIMFVDVQGYTSMTAQQTRDEQQLFIKEIQTFIEKNVKASEGNLVKTMGDGFLITFDSPTDAISCGKGMLQQIARRNATIMNENNFVSLRIGISTGEVSVDAANDVFGDAVNIAARIQKFADPNEIFIAESTYLAMNKAEIKAQDLGPQRFKNVLQEIRVFKILKDNEEQRVILKPPERLSWPVVGIMIGIVILLCSIIVFEIVRARRANNSGRKNILFNQEQKDFFEKKLQDAIEKKNLPITVEQIKNLPPQLRNKLMHKILQEGNSMNAPRNIPGAEQLTDKAGPPPEESMPARSFEEERRFDQGWGKLCGDGICDAAEQADSRLCPQDCEAKNNQAK